MKQFPQNLLAFSIANDFALSTSVQDDAPTSLHMRLENTPNHQMAFVQIRTKGLKKMATSRTESR